MYQVVGSVYETNVEEAQELIWIIIRAIQILAAILVAFFLIYLIILRRNFHKPLVLNKLFCLTVVVTCIVSILGMNLLGIRFSKVYPFSAVRYQIKYFKEIYRFRKTYEGLNYEFSGRIDSPSNLRETYILIIGEAARKASMSIYGYPQNTTPILQNLVKTRCKNVIPYTNAISASAFTRVSVPIMLSVTDAESLRQLAYSPSIIRIFNAVGYKTFLISNQPRRGFHQDVISTMMKDVAYSVYLEDIGYLDRTYDAAVIPFLRQCLKDTCNKKLIVVHLMGSHYNYKERYPPDFSFFGEEGLVTTYNNSIRYTDYVFGGIAKEVLKSDEAIALLYASDHGENLNDNNDGNTGHGLREFTRYELEIPFIFVLNAAFIEVKASKVERLIKRTNHAVSHDHVSHSLLGLAGIYDNQVYQESKDLSSLRFLEQERYVIDRDMNIFLVNLYQRRILKALTQNSR